MRWQPGTRMAYSNPGYAVAAYLIEKVTGEKYEDRIAEKIFKPAGMPTSSFVLTKDDEAILAKGYRDRTGPPVPYSQIYLAARRQPAYLGARARPLGAPAPELGRDGRRSRDRSRVPQQHGAPAHDASRRMRDCAPDMAAASPAPRSKAFRCSATAAASKDSRRLYGYSTSRDVGYVILLNSTHSPEAMRRIAKLAVRYLKADVEPPPKPKATVAESTLRSYEGYYHDAEPAQPGLRVRRMVVVGPERDRQRRSPRGEAGVRQVHDVDPGRRRAVPDRG